MIDQEVVIGNDQFLKDILHESQRVVPALILETLDLALLDLIGLFDIGIHFGQDHEPISREGLQAAE